MHFPRNKNEKSVPGRTKKLTVQAGCDSEVMWKARRKRYKTQERKKEGESEKLTTDGKQMGKKKEKRETST